MALGQFSISFSQMEATVESAKQQSQHISDLLDQMNSAVRSQQEHWLGSAAEQFQNTYTYCQTQAQALPQMLDSAGNALAAVNSGTQQTESGNAKLFLQN